MLRQEYNAHGVEAPLGFADVDTRFINSLGVEQSNDTEPSPTPAYNEQEAENEARLFAQGLPDRND